MDVNEVKIPVCVLNITLIIGSTMILYGSRGLESVVVNVAGVCGCVVVAVKATILRSRAGGEGTGRPLIFFSIVPSEFSQFFENLKYNLTRIKFRYMF